MYFNVNFNVFLNKKVHLLVSELYIYQNARCNNKKKLLCYSAYVESVLNKNNNVWNNISIQQKASPVADYKRCALLPNVTDKICGFRTRNQRSEFFHENYRIHNLKCIVTTYDLVLYKAGDIRMNVI